MIKRDAINEILLSLNELPLDDDDIIEDVPTAVIVNKELDIARKKVLQYGWNFNTVSLTLVPNTYGYIVISQEYLAVIGESSNIIVRDWKLFDKSVPTYKFDVAQTITVYEDLPFDDLPNPIANYVVQVASLQAFIDIIGGSDDINIRYKQIVEAKTEALCFDANSDKRTVLENNFASSIIDRTSI